MEEMNRKLTEKLEQTNRAHDEQMKELLERFGQLSNRLNGAPAPEAVGSSRVDLQACKLEYSIVSPK